MSRSVRQEYPIGGGQKPAGVRIKPTIMPPKKPWEAWLAMGVTPGVHYYLELDGTAGALAKALAILPPDTTLDLGGAPDGSSPGTGIWYYPHWGKAGVM